MAKQPKDEENYIDVVMDFLQDPVFSPNGVPCPEFDGKLEVSLTGPKIEGDVAQILYMFAEQLRENKFTENRVAFLFDDLSRSRQDNNFARFCKAIDNLFGVSVEIEGKKGNKVIRTVRWRILTECIYPENKNHKKGTPSWVRFSDEMMKFFRTGALGFISRETLETRQNAQA